jgi:hypothetical protein
MELVVQKVYLKINPKTNKVMVSCTKMQETGWREVYVSNSEPEGTQEQLHVAYQKQKKR